MVELAATNIPTENTFVLMLFVCVTNTQTDRENWSTAWSDVGLFPPEAINISLKYLFENNCLGWPFCPIFGILHEVFHYRLRTHKIKLGICTAVLADLKCHTCRQILHICLFGWSVPLHLVQHHWWEGWTIAMYRNCLGNWVHWMWWRVQPVMEVSKLMRHLIALSHAGSGIKWH